MEDILLREKEMCCNKEMVFQENAQNMLHPNADTKSWVCLECGHTITLIEDQLDEEELDDLKENLEGLK